MGVGVLGVAPGHHLHAWGDSRWEWLFVLLTSPADSADADAAADGGLQQRLQLSFPGLGERGQLPSL